MISIDLSKAPSLRILLYLLALLPGVFFLSSVAFAAPQLAKVAIENIKGVYPFAPYALFLIFLGMGFVVGQAFIVLSWLTETILFALYRLPRASFRNVFGGNALYRWFGKHQGMPPRRDFATRAIGKLIFLARGTQVDSSDAQAMRWCLMAATEKLLERRYGIGKQRASGGNGGEWYIWASNLGKPQKFLVESRNAGRVMLACGLAGFMALFLAPRLVERYYISLCSLFAFSGLWTAGWFFFAQRNPVRRDALQLRSVLLELQDCSPSRPKTDTTQAE